MKDLLTDRWSSWVDAHGPGDGFTLQVTKVKQVLVAQLKADDFEVPGRSEVEEALTANLEELTTSTYHNRDGRHCSYYHLLNLVWQPILRYIEKLAIGEDTKWSKSLGVNHEALSLEMDGVVTGCQRVMHMDEWFDFVKKKVYDLAGVEISIKSIKNVVSLIVPLHLEPTRANALHILRSSLCDRLVGPSLRTQINRQILAEVSELPVPLMSDQELRLQIKKDLVETLEKLHCQRDDDEDLGGERPTKKMKRDPQSIKDLMVAKTEQVLFALENRTPLNRTTSTLVDAISLKQNLTGASSSSQDPLGPALDELLVSRHTLTRHMLLLDGALDRISSEIIYNHREMGNFAGVALASDESPPNQPRFRGLRFQITVMYVGIFAPLAEWESSSAPPITSRRLLGDIMHCPSKKGADVSKILEKQLARVGLNSYDVVACTGDGGGENEGVHGVHAHFEDLSPGYVRHRCLPHIAWRTADMAIRASNLDYKTLAAYLVEGITWSRLREIATRSVADGGLELFRDGSRACQHIFGKAPSAIVSTRPETDLNFLKVLKSKEHHLHKLATKDLEQRTTLGADTTKAVQNLGDIKLRICRAILGEIIERCLFLMYWNSKHTRVACETSWDELMSKATFIILDLEISEYFLERFKYPAEELAALDPRPQTWVELVVLDVVGERDLVDGNLQEALDFHRSVSGQAAAHLALLLDNTFRTPWTAAKLLSRDKAVAQAAAQTLSRHLASTRPSNHTAFEKHIFETEVLWKDLVDFAAADPPVLLWQGHGQYETLFRFLAPRFLVAPDHVLDAERVHSRWQWVCNIKHSLKMQTLNACLRMQFFLENNQAFPPHEDLWPHLEAEREEHRLSLEAIVAEGEVALGYRQIVSKIQQPHASRHKDKCVGMLCMSPHIYICIDAAIHIYI